MPPKKLLSQLGNIEEFATTYTADIQHRDGQGKKQHIRGPGRSSRTLTGGAPIPGPSPFKPNGLEINPDPFHANGLEVKGSRDRSNN